MKRTIKLTLALISFLFLSLNGSSQCTYTLDMDDSFGDGWNGANITVYINGVPSGTYSASGYGSISTFTGCNGDVIDIVYSSGSFENENTYTLSGPGVFFSDGPYPLTGTVYTFTVSGCAVCPSCTDGIQNGNETGIDCGGDCIPCHCTNGIQDNGETGVDCGSVCGVPCPCNVTIAATPASLPCGGGTVQLIADGQGSTQFAMNNDFDGGSAGPGWSVSAAGQFNNPCDPSVDGGTYMWMGNTTAAPRTMETAPLDLSCGGEVCFYLDFATQGGASPCEGPDLTNEGVYFEYSTDGGVTWTTINYFQPNASGAAGTITSWNQYCYQIPPAAQTANTIFQWFQSGSSGTCCDHWGIDNVTITTIDCNSYYYDWSHVAGSPNDSDQVVSLTQTTDFTVCYTNGVDDSCCTTITIPVDSLDPLVISPTDETCIGYNDGSATITASNGTANYTFDLQGPVNTSQTTGGTATFSNLPPGSYTVTVTDAAGCQTTSTFTIGPGITCCPMTNSETFTDVSCFGANDGEIVLNETSGNPPVNFSIDGGTTFQSGTGSMTFSNLGPGTYDILIEDANGCQYTSTVTITEPTQIDIAFTTVDATCGQANGEISLSATGGVPPYSFSIDGGTSFQGSGLFTGLNAGNYNVVVEDATGCQATIVVSINNTGAPTINSVTVTEPSCPGVCDGQIVIVASGGTGTLQYSIDNGATFQAGGTFTGLCGGNYDILVEDANQCPAVSSATLTDPTPITYTVTTTDILCNGNCTGVIDITGAAGGTGTFQYSIDNGTTFQAGGNFPALCAGTYDIIVEDGNGCQETQTATINEPPVLTIASTFTDPLCASACDGTIDLSGSTGGNGTLQYSIDNGVTYQASASFTGLCAGTYDVMVQDANGCTDAAQVTLTDPAPVTFTFTTVDATCGQANGEIAVTASGGDGNYQYSNDNGATYQAGGTFTGLLAGSYDVIVVDGNGCADTQTVAINNFGAPVIDSTQFTNPLCVGSCDGTVTIFATGGTGTLSYSIDGGATFQAANNFTGVCAGTHNITVEDANGCQVTGTVTLTDPPAVTFNSTIVNLECYQVCIGEINLTGIAGGAPPYQFSIDNGATFQADSSFTGLCAGTYDVVVMDDNGCTATSTETVFEPAQLTYTAAITDASCNQANGPCDGEIVITATGGTGTYQYSIDNGATFQASNTFSGLCAGTYDILVEDANLCQTTGQETVTEPVALGFTTTSVNTSCGQADGELTFTGSGGTGAYQFSIDGGATYQAGTNFTGLGAGSYNSCIIDANGCEFCQPANVQNDAAQSIDTIIVTDATCFNACDGALDVTVTGGTPPIQYSINGGAQQTSNVFTGLCAGTYTVTTEDFNGCQAIETVVIAEPDSITYSTNLTDLVCYQQCDGEIEITGVAGGDGTYQYSIDGGATYQVSPIFTGLCAGTYDLSVQDGNGCLGNMQVTLIEPTQLQLGFTITDATCNGYCDGTAVAVVSGGTSPYSYAWSAPLTAGPTDDNAQAICAGTYDLTVTDDNGCVIDTLGFVVNEPAPYTIDSINVTDESCSGSCDGAIDIFGPVDTQYSIDDGSTFQPTGSFTALCGGSYDVVIMNPAGCQDSTTVNITTPSPLTLTVDNDTTICQTGSANICANASGGTTPYTYDWDIPAQGACQTVSPAQTTSYDVTVTDANGCQVGPETVTVNVNPPLQAIALQDASICPGDSAQIEGAANGGNGGPYTFTWIDDQGNVVSTNQLELVWPTQTTTYTLIVEDGCETPADSASITITVLPLPDLLFGADNFSGCVPLTVNFTNNTDPNMTGDCSWDFGDGSPGTTDCDPTHTFTQPGCYDISFSVSSPDGCKSDTTVMQMICVNALPEPDFEFGPQPTTINDTEIEFTNTSTNSTAYVWDFGDGSPTSTVVNPVHIYPNDSGSTYEVCLTATSVAGCDSTVCQLVVIDDEFLIYVPNAFTPDGDGINDLFQPVINGASPEDFNFYIFDRWGQLIWEAHHPGAAWDGSVNGSGQAKTDTYVWKLVFRNKIDGGKEEYIGHVTLLR